jgi:hypothetical protein
MTWTAPTPPEPTEGPLVGADRPILEAYLDAERHSLLNICAGLTGEQLAARPVPPSNLSLLGLVRHMAKVERVWFRERAAGEQLEPMFDPALGRDADFEDIDPTRAAADFGRYAAQLARAREIGSGLAFEHTFERRGQMFSLRFVYVHMIAEYARHNGHADLLREVIDGTTGR